MKKKQLLFCLYFTSISFVSVNPLPIVFSYQSLQTQNRQQDRLQPEIRSTIKSETTRELITPDAILHDQGSCYRARLAIPRSADRESSSKCVLLEDGKPLPHPHARHKLIREQGRGHYSHWTTDTLYFSASDSSHPKTNGKKYELVNKESYLEKESSFVLSATQSAIEFPSFPERTIHPVKLIWHNLDPQIKVEPHWKRKGAPDLSSQNAMLASILKPGMQEEEKALAIWKLLVDWRYHFTPAEQGDELHDPVKFLNVYGYGFCDDCATNFAVLARKAGLRSRVWGLSGHVVAEAFYDGQWHMFDADHQVFYRNQKGTIAGVEELARHPELITKTKRDPIGSPSHLIADLYTSTNNNRASERHPQMSDSTLSPMLEPLDRVEFRFTNPEYVHQKNSSDASRPPVVGNGTLTRTVRQIQNLKQTAPNRRQWHLSWPYVLLKGKLELALNPATPIPMVYVSPNTKSWHKLEGVYTNQTLAISLDQWIQNQPTAVYECFIRIENSNGTDPVESIKQLNSELIFQFAPRALAHLQRTDNHFEMNLTPSPKGKGKGIKVQLVWKETE
ncbi:transglutaminase-like domain-containing protein [uncultured Gimesia sp.]|uniref:transglutaminase-like domain-containing protein n=1 Tax=uncultured Gimesia sp. TaxID=1678688 RepID=UPI0030DB7363|tara:strand:+ start:65178 stop:66863 length:1686 start_codon:yes stop_codon:yes gene_type:complete